MEHVTIIDLGDKYKLVPEAGYRLLDTRNNRTYSEAVIKKSDLKYFQVV